MRFKTPRMSQPQLRLGLRAKLFGGFGAVLALMAVIGFVGWKNSHDFSHDFEHLYDNDMMSLIYLNRVSQALYELRISTLGFAQADEFTRQRYREEEARWFAQIEEGMNAYRATQLTPEERAALAHWDTAYGKVVENATKIKELEQNKNTTAATIYRTSAGTRNLTDANEAVSELIAIQQAQGAKEKATVSSTATSSMRLLVGGILTALVLGLSLAFLISRAIARAVAAVGLAARRIARDDLPSFVQVARALAAGDLTHRVRVSAERVRVTSTDELGAMAADFNEMIDGLRATGEAFATMSESLTALVGEVRSTADVLAGASRQLDMASEHTSAAVDQVAQAIQGMAAGAQETSSAAQSGNFAVEELSRVIDEIAAGAIEQAQRVSNAAQTATRMALGVQQVAADAGSVAAASEQARITAQRGAEAVQQTVAGMTEIRGVVTQAAARVEELGKLGERIGAVVEVIDDIAEQTNLLALNAAIEAARAGQHGRGFAVVADEVRKLAERSQRETKAIAQLIEQVQTGTAEAVAAMETGSAQVEAGTAQAGRTGMALAEILVAVESTVTQATGIAAAAREMAEGARGLQESMDLMAASVEANRAATEEMVAQAASVTQAMQAIAAVSEEQSASSEEVSASAEEMSAQMQQMGQQSQELARAADQLRQLVARFVLEHAADAAHMTPLQRAA